MQRAIVGACTSVMTAVERKYFLIFFIVRNAHFTHFSQNFRKISYFTGFTKPLKSPPISPKISLVKPATYYVQPSQLDGDQYLSLIHI